MTDPRMKKLADLLISHSVSLQKGEAVLIEAIDIPHAMVSALVESATAAGGAPMVLWKNNEITRDLYNVGSVDDVERRLTLMGEVERYQMEKVQAYIGIRGSHNTTELADVPADKMKIYQDQIFTRVHAEYRVPKTKWCVLRWPTPAMAQLAGMSTNRFEDFYFDVVLVDYHKMGEAVKPLVEVMSKTDQVHIKGPGATDLSFSIKDIPVIPCSGSHNIPDGECFTAPVRESVNGVIEYNARTIYHGLTFDGIKLTFEKGKVVDTECAKNDQLVKILDSDPGARYIGEFALGFNPKIMHPMCDILFDEKIGGSLHLALGNAYDDADNGNRSAVHWDMVLIQRPDFGGGEVWFDGELIRKDGTFIIPELAGLNPDNL